MSVIIWACLRALYESRAEFQGLINLMEQEDYCFTPNKLELSRAHILPALRHSSSCYASL